MLDLSQFQKIASLGFLPIQDLLGDLDDVVFFDAVEGDPTRAFRCYYHAERKEAAIVSRSAKEDVWTLDAFYSSISISKAKAEAEKWIAEEEEDRKRYLAACRHSHPTL